MKRRNDYRDYRTDYRLGTDERKTCCLCHTVCGVSQRDLCVLPNGEVAEERCINKKIFREIIQPLKSHIPNINHLSLHNTPESLLNGLAKELSAQPITPLVREYLGKVVDFSSSFLGKEIILSNFVR